MENLLEFGQCRVCDKAVIWIPMVDGLLTKLEVCSNECLKKLLQELEEKGEVEGKQ